ncbi:protein btn-1 [Nematostella vectensis]|uniref:protein btn-1 n=1 Tax=Nematostella vectensis TaxID=45351 RepID=UPI00207767A7|nr:protein btn-1 [Nematostella vectensis]
MDKTEDDNNDNSCILKSKIIIKVLPICLHLYVGFFAFFFSGFSVPTTLAFPNAPFKPLSHFKFYTLAFGVSRFLGGSELLFISRLCPRILPYARIHRLWVLSLLDIAHAVFFIFATWYRFIPNVWIVLALCATHGFISGSVMVNGALEAAEQFEDPVKYITASVVGLFVEPALKAHCQQDLMLGQFCFTRTNYTTGWSHPKC